MRPLGLAALLVVTSCNDRPSERAPSKGATAAEPAPPAVPARRPTRRFFFERTQAGCQTYAVDLDGGSAKKGEPCPLDLRVGERIRVAGKGCVREGAEAFRREPVVCPDPLLRLEQP